MILLGAYSGPTSAAEVVDLPSANGGTQHVWYDAPAHPWAVAIMFIGGNGVMPFEEDGSLKGGRSTLVRTRQLWVDQGVAVVIPGKPSGIPASNFFYRLTDAYAQDIASLVDFAHSHWQAPIWLLGHSLGSNSAVAGATRPTTGKIAGIVVAGGTFYRGANGEIKETVFDVPIAKIGIPVLVTEHEHETCPPSSPEGAARFRAALTGSPATDLFLFNGGEPSGGPCDPTALHSYVGLDAEFVTRVAAWMRSHNATP
jgi:hypothetical protein